VYKFVQKIFIKYNQLFIKRSSNFRNIFIGSYMIRNISVYKIDIKAEKKGMKENIKISLNFPLFFG
jgi:membrane protein CcdC involved in cytochrome C biogenesis